MEIVLPVLKYPDFDNKKIFVVHDAKIKITFDCGFDAFQIDGYYETDHLECDVVFQNESGYKIIERQIKLHLLYENTIDR